MSDRKKPKKYEKMDYMQKESYVKDQLKDLGQSAVYRPNMRGSGSHSTGMFDLQKSEQALLKAAHKDYDRRESIKYGVDSGDKRFKNVSNSGFDDINALVNADRAISKYGYNQLDMKNVNSDRDYASISSGLFNASRDKFGSQFATKDDLNNQKPVEVEADTKPRELSDRGRAAIDSANYKFKPVNRGLGGSSIAYDPNAGIASDKAGAFMNQYKKDIKTNIGTAPNEDMMSIKNSF